MFSVSDILVDLDLSSDLTVLVLFLLGVSTVLLGCCDFSVLLTVSIFFFAEIGGVRASSATLGSDFHYLSTMSVFPSLTTVSVVVTNVCLV